MMSFRKQLLSMTFVLAALVSTSANATLFTTTSPTAEGALPSGVTEVGGIVLDLVGNSGNRVVSQLAASSLFVGFAGTNPFDIGTQTGFTAGVLSALGGGIAEASVRFTLWDGDTSPGNFDYNQNSLLLDGKSVGNWSSVTTEITDGSGTVSSGFTTGFSNNALNTGFFHITNTTDLSNLFADLADGSLTFGLSDVDPFDNYFDFTQGIDGGLVDVGTGPTVTTPEPMTMLLMGLGMLGLGFSRRRS